MSSSVQEARYSQDGHAVKLKEINHLELYVGNAQQAAHYYCSMFGFRPLAYAGLETGLRDRVSYVVEQRNIRLVLTTALCPEGPIAEHVKLHGDGVKDIAFSVADAAQTFQEAVRRGAQPVLEPTVFEDDNGQVIKATIKTFGDTVHSFIQNQDYDNAFLPNYQPIVTATPAPQTGMAAIDHVAISVEAGTLDQWIDFYRQVLGFHRSHEEDVSTEYSAMNSKVVQNSTGRIKFPMMEPAPAKRKSQIEEYLSFYRGPGVQHFAVLTDNIVRTVRLLRENGIQFLGAPGTYYETLEDRIGPINEDVETLRELNILADRDGSGYLMQIFSKPLQTRPTAFLEVIQRKGAIGFGGGNIKALFEAIEREQALRATL